MEIGIFAIAGLFILGIGIWLNRFEGLYQAKVILNIIGLSLFAMCMIGMMR